ncbi:MAG: AAA family ATPase [Verrucomicrobia bacterium]|nr:AAA family ATPase [Verrucomicrobiota bacterium]
MPAQVLAFLNFKGGVGKTTSVVNLGAGLGYFKNKRVLVVDLDAQCNSTFWLLRPDHFAALEPTEFEGAGSARTSWQIFRDAVYGTSLFQPTQAIIRGVPRSEAGYELIPNLHLLPGSLDLIDVDFEADTKVVGRMRAALREALEPLRAHYDYILLDCPPHLHYVTQSALLAADHVVLPYNPDYLSLSGLYTLSQLLDRIDVVFAQQRAGQRRANIAAVVICRHQLVGRAYGTAIAELKSRLDLLRHHRLVHPQCALLEPYVRHDVSVAEAASEHLPVLLHRPNSNATIDYKLLSNAFVAHFNSLR